MAAEVKDIYGGLVALMSTFQQSPRCPKCTAGYGTTRIVYLSEREAAERFGLPGEKLLALCGTCNYTIAVMPCADAKKEA